MNMEELGKAMGGKGNLPILVGELESMKPPSSEPRESRKSLRKSSQISRSSVNRPEIRSVTRARQLWRTSLLPARISTASPQTTPRWRWGRCRRSRLPENSGEVLLGQPLSTSTFSFGSFP